MISGPIIQDLSQEDVVWTCVGGAGTSRVVALEPCGCDPRQHRVAGGNGERPDRAHHDAVREEKRVAQAPARDGSGQHDRRDDGETVRPAQQPPSVDVIRDGPAHKGEDRGRSSAACASPALTAGSWSAMVTSQG
jgi:hypothetical protein